MKWVQQQKGFTIVELLIVVVVIAILAAITIVAYNGIQNRAKHSSAQSAAAQANKKVAIWLVDNPDQAPDLAQFTTLVGDVNISKYQYTPGVNGAFCITATINSVSYYSSNAQTNPVAGACAGHGLNGQTPITNLITNPSSEVGAMVLGTGGGGTVSRTTAEKYSGAASSLLTKGTGWAYITGGGGNSIGVGGDTVTFSAWVKSSSSPIYFTKRGGGVTYGVSSKAVPLNTWTRISETYTVQAGATSFFIDIGWEAATAPSGTTLYVDASMATSGSTLYNFADGNSPGWAWSGMVNASSSVGTPL